MKTILKRYFTVCPKTGKVTGFKSVKGWSRLLFPIVGLIAVFWILIRVIPKPSRLAYPCMRVAAPFASGFVVYLLGLIASASAFFKSRELFRKSRYIIASGLVIIGILASLLIFHGSRDTAFANYTTVSHVANSPIGEAQGIFPGRVVWVYNPDATNENCVSDAVSHAWFMSENNNQAVSDSMVSSAIQNLTGEVSDSAAWRAIFQYHNATRGKGAVSYSPGENIFVKINATSAWSGNYNTSDLSKVANSYYGISETSPAIVMAVLRQLVNVVGVAQTNIYIGDPMKHIYKHLYDYWHSEFPNVHYLDNSYSTLGREKVVTSTTAIIHYSDHGDILRTNVWYSAISNGEPVYSDNLYKIFEDAEYLINIPMLKGHRRAGVTMFAKNHFGSNTRADAAHLHNGLVAPIEDTTQIYRKGYGLYRVQVDIMSHSLLGRKNLFYLMDALWATDHELDKPLKFQMAPFNNDYMSSVFVSFDPIAIESVGYDFLRAEFAADRVPSANTCVQMDGVDDYLHQAADSLNWASGIKYDPDSNGVHLKSLGTHEHWNDATAMQYSRNLDPENGTGIELTTIGPASTIAIENKPANVVSAFNLYPNSPNPFNATTNIRYSLSVPARVELNIYNLQGQLVANLVNSREEKGEYLAVWNGTTNNGRLAPSGVYIYELRTAADRPIIHQSRKMLLVK